VTEAIAQVRSIGDEVQRSTEAQRGDSHAMAAAVSAMSSRFQDIVQATRLQDNEQNRIKASVTVFDEATKSTVERARQIGQAVSALNERLEQLEEQLHAFRVS
jgi:septation ring formation regulator EzrA